MIPDERHEIEEILERLRDLQAEVVTLKRLIRDLLDRADTCI